MEAAILSLIRLQNRIGQINPIKSYRIAIIDDRTAIVNVIRTALVDLIGNQLVDLSDTQTNSLTGLH
jgi:hypothetical protein